MDPAGSRLRRGKTVANKDALRAVCKAIKALLESNRGEWDGETLEVSFCTTLDVSLPGANDRKITITPYRIFPAGDFRNPPSRPGPDGIPRRAAMPLELHVLFSVWTKSAEWQTSIAGWMMRVLHDHPTLTAAQLNAAVSDSFDEDESVDVLPADLSTENLVRIWELMKGEKTPYALSVPYVARTVRIQSEVKVPQRHITERWVDFRSVEGA